jgi:KaiC/GvpD/RAD55 family RecA-like ATPase
MEYVRDMDGIMKINDTEYSISRLKTGINGLDELLEGGFPEGSTIVVTGTPGSGKSIFGMNFIAEGCKNGKKCLYISVEQLADEIVKQAMQFGWDFNQWEKEGKLKVVSLGSQKLFEMNALSDIRKQVEENHYDRVVIDSITSLVYAPFTIRSIVDGADRGLQPHALIEMSRTEVISLIDLLQYSGITTIVTSQKVEGMPGDTYDNVSEFKGDGLVVLNSAAIGRTLNRTLQVKKLRKTKIDGVPHTFEFTNEGISIKP